jgi:hypothetical protein
VKRWHPIGQKATPAIIFLHRSDNFKGENAGAGSSESLYLSDEREAEKRHIHEWQQKAGCDDFRFNFYRPPLSPVRPAAWP